MSALGCWRGIPGLARELNRQGQGIWWWTPRSTSVSFFFVFFSLQDNFPWRSSAIRILRGHFHQSATFEFDITRAPPKWTVFIELQPMGVPGAQCLTVRERAVGVLHLGGSLDRRKDTQDTWGCPPATKKDVNTCNRCTQRKTWNLGMPICIWHHQLQDFNAQVARFVTNSGVHAWIYHLNSVRTMEWPDEWRESQLGKCIFSGDRTTTFSATTLEVLFPCKWHSCVILCVCMIHANSRGTCVTCG